MRQVVGKGEGTDIFIFLYTRCSQLCNIFAATILTQCHCWPPVPAEQPLQGMTPKHAHAPCSSRIRSYLEPWRVQTQICQILNPNPSTAAAPASRRQIKNTQFCTKLFYPFIFLARHPWFSSAASLCPIFTGEKCGIEETCAVTIKTSG